MFLLFGIGLILLVAYAIFMLLLQRKFLAASPNKMTTNGFVTPTYTILIPARNEAKNIKNLLYDLQQQKTINAFVEIIVIDDASTDATALIVSKFPNVKLLQLSKNLSGKKMAISKGVSTAKGNYIITLDADVRIGSSWLLTIHQFILNKKNVIALALPVFMQGKNGTLLDNFQEIDFITMQGITEVAVNSNWFAMCNGANFLYSKAAFLHVHGFDGNQNLPSGDDMFLMQKFINIYADGVYYIADELAAATTATEPNIKAFLNQRIRWASKAKAFTNGSILLVLLLVYAFNVWFVIGLFGLVFNWSLYYGIVFLLFFAIKILVEYLVAYKVGGHFSRKINIIRFTLLQPFHIGYIICSASFGLIGKYNWKGRAIK